MAKLTGSCLVIAALLLATASAAQDHPMRKHPHRVARPVPSQDIVVRTGPAEFFPPGYISNGFYLDDGGINGISGDDSYGPPRGFHGGLYSYGVYNVGPGGPYDKVEGCATSYPCY